MDWQGRSRQTVIIAATAVALAACSHRTLQVERAMVLPPAAQVHTVAPNQGFLMAVPIEDPDPAYPVDARLDGALQVCATFVVTSEGEVIDIAIDRAATTCADPDDEATKPFADALLGTLPRWRYFAAAICTFPYDIDPGTDPRCDGADVRVDAVPIRLRYVFAFSSERGGRVSRAHASAAAR
jgi:hypothetical protein